jgi:phosphinothricin acetyltransferase
MMKKDALIRDASIGDLEAIVNIYNYAVHAQFETADIDQVNWKRRMGWFKGHTTDRYPIYVYEINGTIVGWISLSPYRKGRKALQSAIEISYYVHPDYKQQGVGSQLMKHAISISKLLRYKTLLAIALDKNERSINLLVKFGFEKWGHLPNIAEFNGMECGHVYYGLRISP